MNTLQDVREAQQMWESKFKNAGHEGIELRIGKSRLLSSILGSIIHNTATKEGRGINNLRMNASKSGAI